MRKTLETISISCLLLTAFRLPTGFGEPAKDLAAVEQDAFRRAAAEVAPTVVMIETAGGLDRMGHVLKGEGPTTGLILKPEGIIVTSAFNFFNKPSSILVTLSDGRRFSGSLLATDHTRLISIVKIEATDLPMPAWAPKKELQVGQRTLALGRAWGDEQPALSVGILSAVGRIWGKAIQTDAKVSPSNYGGPLTDLRGRVMGILVPLSPDMDSHVAGIEWYDSGIGFAIPIEDILESYPRLVEAVELKRGFMGIQIVPNLFAPEVEIVLVMPGSPAAEAGIQKGDRIVEVDGRSMKRGVDFRYAMASKFVGDAVNLKIRRGQEDLALSLKMADAPRPVAPQPSPAKVELKGEK